MDDLTLLEKISSAFGPSSAEHEVRRLIINLLPDTLEYVTTAHGNLIVYDPKSKGSHTLMFQAHMDELGFRPYRYLDEGYVQLSPASPIPKNASNHLILFKPTCVLGILVLVENAQQRQYYLDLGAKDGKEAQKMVPYYSNGAYAPSFHETPQFICGKSFDDRAGCTLVLQILRETMQNGSPNNIVGCFTVREESGNWPLRELRDALDRLRIHPDLLINLEVCPGGPIPGDEEPMAILGQGVTLTHMDRYYISDGKLCQFMVELAEKEHITFQQMAERSGGGELGRLCHIFGTNGFSLVLPGRYMHSPHSVISRDDFRAARKMCEAISHCDNIMQWRE